MEIPEIQLKDFRSRLPRCLRILFFSGNIYGNILRGDPDTTEKDVIHSAILAKVHDFIIMRLPDSYRTEVGEGGVKLSGGKGSVLSLPGIFSKMR